MLAGSPFFLKCTCSLFSLFHTWLNSYNSSLLCYWLANSEKLPVHLQKFISARDVLKGIIIISVLLRPFCRCRFLPCCLCSSCSSWSPYYLLL